MHTPLTQRACARGAGRCTDARRGCGGASGRAALLRGPDPAVLFGADYAWRADDVSSGGGVTSQWNPFRGSVNLALVGTAQGAPAASANLGGRLAVPYPGAGAYVGELPAPTGDSITVAWVGRNTAASGAHYATTNAGATASGASQFAFSGRVYARRPGFVDASGALAVPYNGVFISTFTLASCSEYRNSATPFAVSAAPSASFSFSTFTLGGVSNLTGTLTGDVAVCAVWTRVLSAAEIASAMARWCARYGQVYAP